jgi:transcriptional regulator with XRE-family HTH domain
MTTHATELGATLRAWRDRLSPAAAGLPSRHARRALGLRREELAELAGISVDYVVRLEQHRSTTPSAQVVAALARALQLTNSERDHLYRLARLAPPAHGEISDHIPPGVQRVLSRLGDAAVAVFAADWQLIWWNRGWAALLGDPSSTGSQRFAELWASGAVSAHREDHKIVEHPAVGPIALDCDVLTDGDAELKIVILTAAPDTEDETKLRLAFLAGVPHPARS